MAPPGDGRSPQVAEEKECMASNAPISTIVIIIGILHNYYLSKSIFIYIYIYPRVVKLLLLLIRSSILV